MASPCVLRAVVLIRIAVWDINSSTLDGDDKFPSSRPSKQISHDCQTVRHLSPFHLLDDPNAETTGQMVDDPQSAMDTEPGRLSTLYDRQHETFPRHILCEGGLACKTLGQLQVDLVHHPGVYLLTYQTYRITAVQAVTCSHPGIVERVASGNASGRCVLWAPPEDFEPQDKDVPKGDDTS